MKNLVVLSDSEEEGEGGRQREVQRRILWPMLETLKNLVRCRICASHSEEDDMVVFDTAQVDRVSVKKQRRRCFRNGA
jgi:hypothetical protein